MRMDFDDRNSLIRGNLLLSVGAKEDTKASAHGYEFLGVAAGLDGSEIHVFCMAQLESPTEQKVKPGVDVKRLLADMKAFCFETNTRGQFNEGGRDANTAEGSAYQRVMYSIEEFERTLS